MRRGFLVALALLPACNPVAAPAPKAPVATAVPAGSFVYTCDGGLQVPVTYGTENDEAVVNIVVDGEKNLLISEPVAQGLRYAWPSDGSYNVWLLNGAIGTLNYRDGERGTEVTVATNCRTS